MILTAEPVGADEAKHIGLINRVVLKEELLDEAVGLALRIAAFAPTAVAACLHAATRGLNASIDEGLAIEAEAFARIVPTIGLQQRLQAFISARKGRTGA